MEEPRVPPHRSVPQPKEVPADAVPLPGVQCPTCGAVLVSVPGSGEAWCPTLSGCTAGRFLRWERLDLGRLE